MKEKEAVNGDKNLNNYYNPTPILELLANILAPITSLIL